MSTQYIHYPTASSGSSGWAAGMFGDASDGSAVLDGTNTVSWASLGGAYSITVSAANAVAGAIYTDSNNSPYQVTTTISGGTTLVVKGATAPVASGTLTLSNVVPNSDATIIYSLVSKTSSSYYQTRPAFCNNLSISAGVTLEASSFSISCEGTFSNAGIVSCNGGNGISGVGSTAGIGGLGGGLFITTIVAGATGAQNTGSSRTGGNGQTGDTGAGNAGSDGSADSSPAGASGGVGGNGGSGGSGSGGVGGAGGLAVGSAAIFFRSVTTALSIGSALLGGGGSAGGGASGSGDGADSGGSGGGGGGAAGVIAIFTNIFSNSGTIRANGGNGAVGETVVAGNCGGGGGGGGAAGGFIYILANTWSATGTIQVSGGTGAAGGTKHGTGVNGSAGTSGTAGLILKYDLTNGVWL